MTQTMLTNCLGFVLVVGVAVLQHYGLVDTTAATIVYTGVPVYLGASGALKITPGASIVQSKNTTTSASVPTHPSNGVNG